MNFKLKLPVHYRSYNVRYAILHKRVKKSRRHCVTSHPLQPTLARIIGGTSTSFSFGGLIGWKHRHRNFVFRTSLFVIP
jgi:hypothetical protein